MADDLGRCERLFRLLFLIRSQPGLTARSLSEQLGVCDRTVYRDVRTLRELDIPIETPEHEGGYVLGHGCRLPPFLFNEEESLALGFIRQVVDCYRAQPVFTTLAGVIDKIEAIIADANGSVPPEFEEARTLFSIRADHAAVVHNDVEHFVALKDAIKNERRCQLRRDQIEEAQSDGEADSLVSCDPLHLHFWHGRWHLIARMDSDSRIEMIPLSKIGSLKVSGAKSSSTQPFSVQDFLGDAWSRPVDEKAERVVLRFQAHARDSLYGMVWHQTQRTTALSDGRLEVEFRVSGLDDLARWLVGFGAEVEVLKPERLRSRVQTIAHEAYQQHNEKQSEVPSAIVADHGPDGTDLTQTPVVRCSRMPGAVDTHE